MAVITDRKIYPSLETFAVMGKVNAVREPHPHLKEVKKAYQYIKCTLKDPKNLTIAIKNWYDFTNLNAYVLKWSIVGDNGKMLAKRGTVYRSGSTCHY